MRWWWMLASLGQMVWVWGPALRWCGVAEEPEASPLRSCPASPQSLQTSEASRRQGGGGGGGNALASR